MQAEELMKSNKADVIAQRLDELLKLSVKSSDLESQLSGSLKELNSLSEMLEKGARGSSGGLSEADRNFLRELTNDTKDAIQDMRLEVLTASDKSKISFRSLEALKQSILFCRFRKDSHAHQGIPPGS